MEIEDFRLNLLNQAHVRGAAEGSFTKEAFLAEVADRLADAGEIEQLNVVVVRRGGQDDAENSRSTASTSTMPTTR